LNDLCAAAWREDFHGFQQIISDVPPAGLAGVFSGKNTKVAAFFEKSEVIALLLFSGANYNLRNSLGKTPTEVSQGASAEIFAQFLSV